MGLKQQLTTVSSEEIVDAVPCLSKQEVSKIERRALSLYGEAQRTSVLLAVELRRLQNGAAHLARGYPNFGDYIEHTFEGINKNTAQQLSREGEVLILLEKAGKIGITGKGENLPGTTGVRSLALILKKFGEEIMLAAYEKAAETGRKITADTVLAATRELEVVKAAELEEGGAAPIDVETDEDEVPVKDDEFDGEEHEELRDRLGELQDVIYTLSDCLAEGKAVEAMKELEQIEGMFEQIKVELVKVALDATEQAS